VKLAGDVAAIRVGGSTQVEVKKKDHLDAPLHATRAAVEEGILPGGGVALLRSAKAFENLKTANDERRVGIDIIRRAIEAATARSPRMPALEQPLPCRLATWTSEVANHAILGWTALRGGPLFMDCVKDQAASEKAVNPSNVGRAM
jgi:chaperonin GroEL